MTIIAQDHIQKFLFKLQTVIGKKIYNYQYSG